MQRFLIWINMWYKNSWYLRFLISVNYDNDRKREGPHLKLKLSNLTHSQPLLGVGIRVRMKANMNHEKKLKKRFNAYQFFF